ncbi:unnamed protein product [Protopolystoma xenopodis]|uniref:Uncharacterized protein n=1 Tax=Protopolystoma xenopodis TaxID=117903 RepID=A0A448XDY5_9PLAT|nr:unnamed protein product [Protopolystoma xenopodis]
MFLRFACIVSLAILRAKLRTRQRDKSSRSLDQRSTENSYTFTPLSVLVYLSTLYYLIQIPPYHNLSLVYIPLIKRCALVGKFNLASSHMLFTLAPSLSIGSCLRSGSAS